jgi:hypothetical protein
MKRMRLALFEVQRQSGLCTYKPHTEEFIAFIKCNVSKTG